MGTKSFEDLIVWQKSFAVTLDVYRWTKSFPRDERFGLSAQMRRAGASMPANIAEGFARRSPRDKARFYNIAEGSAEELSVFIRLASELGYGSPAPTLRPLLKEVARMLRTLVDMTLAGSG